MGERARITHHCGLRCELYGATNFAVCWPKSASRSPAGQEATNHMSAADGFMGPSEAERAASLEFLRQMEAMASDSDDVITPAPALSNSDRCA